MIARHSRAGGNPSPDFTHLAYREMDSRLRGNDGVICVLEPYFFGALSALTSSASSFSTLSANTVMPAKITAS